MGLWYNFGIDEKLWYNFVEIYIYLFIDEKLWYNFCYDTWDYGKFSGILRILIEYLATYEHILAPLWDKCLIDCRYIK